MLDLTGQMIIWGGLFAHGDNVLAPHVVPHFDNHALADRPMSMDDNSRPHRAQIVQHFVTARGCSDNSMACGVARHEPYRACMGLYWPKN